MTEPTGQYVEFGTGFFVASTTATTGINGNPYCAGGYNVDLTKPIGIYTGPITTTYLVDTRTISWSTLPNNRLTRITLLEPTLHTFTDAVWIMPDLSKYAPGVEELERCTYVITGGSPKALTPAREIKLPASTLPLSQPSAGPTSTKQVSSDSTTARPVTSDTVSLPVSTPSGQHPEIEPSTGGQQPDSSEATSSRTSGAVVVPVTTTGDRESDEDASPTSRPSDESDEQPSSPDEPPSDNPPATADAPGSPGSESGSPSVRVTTTEAQSVPTRAASVPDSDDGDTDSDSDPDSPSDRVTTAETASVPTQGAPAPEKDDTDADSDNNTPNPTEENNDLTRISTGDASVPPESNDVESGTESADPFASFIAIGVSGEDLDVSNEPNADAHVFSSGNTLAVGEPAVEISGTTFSALPTGVLAVANGQSTTINDVSEAMPTPNAPISAIENDNAAYILEDGSEVTAEGEAVVVSETTYSALPSNSGVIAIAGGSTSTLSKPASVIDGHRSDAYAVGESATISAGGSAATLSGSTYSALPSGSGVLIAASDGTKTLMRTAISAQASKPADVFVIGGSATISAGGSAVVISDTTYSALPSSAGVVVDAGGQSSTIVPGVGPMSNDTSGTGVGDNVVPFEGSATRPKLGHVLHWSIIAAAVLNIV